MTEPIEADASTTTEEVRASSSEDRQPGPGTEGPTVHELKCWPAYFGAVLSGAKRFEFRKNDRRFRAGDLLVLMEYQEDGNRYTGREWKGRITYAMHLEAAARAGLPVHDAWSRSVILSIEPLDPESQADLRLRASQDDCQRLRARVAELEAKVGDLEAFKETALETFAWRALFEAQLAKILYGDGLAEGEGADLQLLDLQAKLRDAKARVAELEAQQGRVQELEAEAGKLRSHLVTAEAERDAAKFAVEERDRELAGLRQLKDRRDAKPDNAPPAAPAPLDIEAGFLAWEKREPMCLDVRYQGGSGWERTLASRGFYAGANYVCKAPALLQPTVDLLHAALRHSDDHTTVTDRAEQMVKYLMEQGVGVPASPTPEGDEKASPYPEDERRAAYNELRDGTGHPQYAGKPLPAGKLLEVARAIRRELSDRRTRVAILEGECERIATALLARERQRAWEKDDWPEILRRAETLAGEIPF